MIPDSFFKVIEPVSKRRAELASKEAEIGKKDLTPLDSMDSFNELAESHMQDILNIRKEWMSTLNFKTCSFTEQERGLLENLLNEKIKQANMILNDWEEALTWDEWKQVSGDVGAATYGAVFCKSDKYGYYFVEVINLEEACGKDGGDYKDGVYWVEEHHVNRDALNSKKAEDVLRSCGDPSRENTSQDIALYMMEYGGHSDGQPLPFHTLREGMRFHDIPSDALWDKNEYMKDWEEEEEGED